ncbi:hypothetical protein HU732_25135 [Pseudomonas proteolytica]|uniref:hypothetical protein n=1 Tax=Pseudomonas proteolytica TaxID=219574 RepID=UPI0016473B6A|nr:hypothetical protein [Pseudomonas proteolytica]MBC3339595.1 hypothetical protein [Pseudomonas proteolytica]
MPDSKSKVVELPAPVLVEAQGQSHIDPLKLLEGATVRACYDGMSEEDQIALWWLTTPNNYVDIGSQQGVEAGCIDFHVPPEYIGMRLDNFAIFYYSVTRNGQELPGSSQGQVRISLPSNLPEPQVLQASSGTLDLGQLCCDDPVTVYVAPWPFIDTIQLCRLYVGGINPDGSKFRWSPFDDEPITEEDVRNGWSRTLSRAELARLKHDSELYLAFSVQFLPGQSRPVYRLFPSLLLNLLIEPHLELSAPHLQESVDCGADGWMLNPVNTVTGAHLQVAYDRMCPGDRVCPTVTGTPGSGSPVLECRVVGEGESSVVFQIPPSAISANLEATVSFFYSVSRSCGGSWQSPSREVSILDISGLPKPVVEQATGNVLDLNTFAGDASATVIPWPYVALGQACWLWVTGELKDGSPYSFEVLSGEALTEEWLSAGVNTPLPRHELQKLADCSDIEVHFAVNFNDQVDRESAKVFRRLVLHITQKDLDLKAPSVREAVDGQLTIWNGRDGVTVRVEYEGISAHHLINVQWIRGDGTILPLEPKPGNNEPGYVDFAIPREAVIQDAGRTVLIVYTVTSPCKLASSQALRLQISVPVRLPTPVVPQATNNILDLRSFAGDADITVEPWWFVLPGQKVWLRGAGTKVDGTAYTINVYLGKEVTAAEVSAGLNGVLKRTELQMLKRDTPLVVSCKVTVGGSDKESEAVEFARLELMLRNAPLTIEEKFEGQATREYTVGGVIDTPTMKVTFVSGPFEAGVLPYGNDQYSSGQCYMMLRNIHHSETPQRHRFDFKHKLEYVKFAWVWKQSPGQVRFYDDSNRMLAMLDYPDEYRGGFWVEYSSLGGRLISSMEVTVQDYSFIDNFTMKYPQ